MDGVALLLAKGVDVSARTLGEATPLMYACQSGNVEVVRQLLAAGAEVFAVDSRGRNAMHAAAVGGSAAIVAELAKVGAAGDEPVWLHRDSNGFLSLHVAVQYNQADVVAALLKLPNAPHGEPAVATADALKRTPLHWAAQKGERRMTMLSRHGALC